ncbi:VOC family protein [Acetobacter sp.]|jgi:catechol 2,3-dioxygenase-like lactoylglutathione lyase family enzyme|uniref:VOC family protein n=1 Tax=Acetobacter sp. TaxID=440 RepID=UPI0025BC3556|nr:VOC family protein [Acetobacter sp.]MCH4090329.1 VOC family protein [Acetobacter sp.]MCI1299023.1 VOC family protein [Acetobacter sp.]MCI1315043.1 VOC family protein [Acetobacter sp.]
MFSHIMLGSNDIERSRTFYDAIFAAIGGAPGTLNPKGRLVYSHNGQRLVIGKPLNGEPATAGNGSTIGFAIETPEKIDAWWKAGGENGGAQIENPPGVRQNPAGDMYLAYLRDPDGNKLCALHSL